MRTEAKDCQEKAIAALFAMTVDMMNRAKFEEPRSVHREGDRDAMWETYGLRPLN